jgi:hypothetical protein
MKLTDILLESAQGRLVRGMLVQTLDQFVKTGGSERPDEELEEELEQKVEPKEQPVRFNPSYKAQYTQAPQDTTQPTDDRSLYSKIISPDDVAKMVHHKNSYVIYYEYKAQDDPTKVLEKRVTTEPIYIPQDKINDLVKKANAFIEEKFPTASDKAKKTKAYGILARYMEKLAVEVAIEKSPEVKYAIDKGVLPQKLKAKQFTTTASKARNPSIHKGSVPIINEEGQIIYDLDGLAARITQRPERLLKVNAKMVKSSGEAISMANIGIPAIAGLVVDEKTKQFVVVNTCPGAGKCKEYCYATRGGYVQYSASSESQARVLNYWYNDPEGFKQQVISELKKQTKEGVKAYLRWHDSGDFFVDAYLHLAFDVARAVPDATIYAYTKIAKVAKDPMMPDNFLINFSDGAKPNETTEIDYKKVKHSIVVPGELFKDEKTTGIGLEKLQSKNPEAQQRMKEVIGQQYEVDPKSVLTYDEMMDMPEGNKLKYNVIVVPGLDGDLGAARRDILGSYLLYH